MFPSLGDVHEVAQLPFAFQVSPTEATAWLPVIC